MYHIIYSKSENDYYLFFEENGRLHYDTSEPDWSDTIQDLITRPFTFEFISTASSSWFQNIIYSSPTKPTPALLTTNPEIFI